MDILYILGKGSRWNNSEIRYSLRSLNKYGQNIRKVYVCGFDAGFFSDEITFIPCDDPYGFAHKNIMYKINHAIEHSDIGEEFLLSSDDHFIVRDTDFDNFPYYKKGELKIAYAKNSTYWKSLGDTYKLLREEGLTTSMCNPHCNTHFSRTAWEETKSIRERAICYPYGCEINCIMGNWFRSKGKELTHYRDVKVKSFQNEEELLEQIGDNHCFSIYDSAIDCGIGKYLNKLFPSPCKYEKESADPIKYKSNTDCIISEDGMRVTNKNGLKIYHRMR